MTKWLAAAAVLLAALVVGCAGGAAVRDAVHGPAAPEQAVAEVAPAPAARAAAVESSSAPSTRPAPATPRAPVNHCAGNTAAQLVLVSIRAQHAWLCQHSTTVYSTAVTTGMTGHGNETPTGHYRIEGRTRNTVLHLNGRSYPVEYWLPFDAPMYGFHDASWQTIPYGSAQYRADGSHGCVHLPLASIAFLYDWVRVGAHVTIAR